MSRDTTDPDNGVASPRFGGSRLSVPVQFVQAFVVDSKVVGDLVEYGAPDLHPKLLVTEPESEVRQVENDNAVGGLAEVVEAAVGQRDALVDAEQPVSFRILVCGRHVLDHDDEVVDLVVDPVGQLREAVVDDMGELGSADRHWASLEGRTIGVRQGEAVASSAMAAPPRLLSESEIQARVDELASQIDADYAAIDSLVLIGVLKGSFIFLADLARRLTIPHRIEFIAVSSYGDRDSEHPESVRLLMDVRHDISGAHVLLVEDIVDTGRTLTYLQRLLATRRPASLKTCTLLHKPDRTEEEVILDYRGFTIPDVWVVGYGLDFAERYRTLPYIGELPPDMR